MNPHHPADWSQPFDDPIPLAGHTPLTTLRQSGEYIAALPAAEQHQAHWQLATELLLMAAERRGPIMHAGIGMLRALNHNAPPRAPEARRKAAKKYRMIR